MIHKVKNYIFQQYLFSGEKAKLIVGVSGGADSVVLLYVLKELGYDCVAAHCNFHLRDDESDRDEKFVSRLTNEWNIPLFKKDFETVNVARTQKISVEMAARQLRYEWFEQLRRKQHAESVCIAHHQEDNVETVLLNLIRGTGIKGLTGMKPKNNAVARPLLCVSKREILEFAAQNRIPFVTDSSNLKDDFTRNKIRLQVLPILETINPSVKESILQTINNLKEAEQIYDHAIRFAIRFVFDKEKSQISIPLLKTFPSPESILFELLSPFGFRKEVIRDIYKAMDAQSGKIFHSPTHSLLKDRDSFIIYIPEKDENRQYSISKKAKQVLSPVSLQIEQTNNCENILIQKDCNMAFLDADKLEFPLVLRKWKRGDRFIPFGMLNFQKISDYFNNNKFSKQEKENTWLLTSGSDIVWIVGHRIDNRYRIESGTKKGYILKLS